MAVGFHSLGSYVPPKVVSNDDIAEWTGVSTEWIDTRTGVQQRRYADEGTTTSDLAVLAAKQVINQAPAESGDLEMIIVATSTPDQPQPSTAAIVQGKLGLPGIAAFDVNAVCSGFVYSLTVANAMLSNRDDGRTALVVGAEMYSRIMNRTDPKTVSLFGDGAGAALLGPVPDGYGIRSCRISADGQYRDYVEVPAGGTRQPIDAAAREAGRHLFHMQGRPVRDYALATFPKVIKEVLADGGLDAADVGRFIFHQANTRLVEECGRQMGLDPDRVPLTAPEVGNTAAASIPLALHWEHQRRPFRRGEHLVLAAVGGGMTAGAALVTWY
ncbi:3-oxoacyl-ACP synthase III family protein [Amycolatopsis benzoatilytica]|uniref:3-oxoacyl-ACP synthase III family protein n=1 Tax=Amycolatopsis benzoatilytica TaxID=346045 RepID=UPI0003A4F1A8|nr:ketoacyl-ACP synthase III [Amycolatopsis benzoatilytica]